MCIDHRCKTGCKEASNCDITSREKKELIHSFFTSSNIVREAKSQLYSFVKKCIKSLLVYAGSQRLFTIRQVAYIEPILMIFLTPLSYLLMAH